MLCCGRWEWLLKNELNAGIENVPSFLYGNWLAGDFPIINDWDEDGDETVGVVRPPA